MDNNYILYLILCYVILFILIYSSFNHIELYDNSKLLNNNSDIYIVYFIYINPNRNWKLILEGQMSDLNKSNILQNNKLFVVISCDDIDNINIAKNIINSILIDYNNNIEFTIESKNLFEYPGIKKVYDLALINQEKIFIYFHSKGMVFHGGERNTTEKMLTNNLFHNWKNTLYIFKNNINVDKIGLFPSKKGFIWYNFFWVRGTYINKLEYPIITDDRYYYEEWLSKLNNSYSLYHNNISQFSQDDTINLTGELLERCVF